MRRGVVVLLLLLVTARGASARGHGHSCGRGCGLWWELGLTGVRFDASSLGTDSSRVPAARGAILGYGGRLRTLFGFGNESSLYLGIEWDAGLVTSGPLGRAGSLFGSKVVFGGRWRAGALSYGWESAAGARFADLDVPGEASPDVVLQPALEARAKGDLWLSPYLTIGASIGVDALDPRDVSAVVLFGAHAGPWDYLASRE